MTLILAYHTYSSGHPRMHVHRPRVWISFLSIQPAHRTLATKLRGHSERCCAVTAAAGGGCRCLTVTPTVTLTVCAGERLCLWKKVNFLVTLLVVGQHRCVHILNITSKTRYYRYNKMAESHRCK